MKPRWVLVLHVLLGCVACLAGCGESPRPPCTASQLRVCRARCNAEDGESCAITAATLVDRDEKQAAELFLKGCLYGHAKSCYAAGLGLMLRSPPSTEMAARAFEAGCQLSNPDACAMRTALLEASHGGAAGGAARAYDETCANGSAIGCTFAGAHFLSGNGVPKDVALGTQFLNRACDLGEATACRRLAEPPAPPPAAPAPVSPPPTTEQPPETPQDPAP